MANKVDVRIIRSKESLISALVSLLKNRSIEELTISELCEKADVNRNTFYSHYSDINDLFDELKGKYMEKAKRKASHPSLRQSRSIERHHL